MIIFNMIIIFTIITIYINREDNEKSNLKFVYTAMHGVGTPFAKRAFETFHLNPFYPVLEQVEPDPDFPTVAFPNPEEGKGSLVIIKEKKNTIFIQLLFICILIHSFIIIIII